MIAADASASDAGIPGDDDFQGMAFDGRYVYFVPHTSSLVARYDTTAPFTSFGSWVEFDLTTLSAGLGSLEGAAFDGHHIYLVPGANGVVVSYDTTAPFAAAGSWSTFDMTTVNAAAEGYAGAAFDGRYVYFAPFFNTAANGVIARYDTTAPFTIVRGLPLSAAGWSGRAGRG